MWKSNAIKKRSRVRLYASKRNRPDIGRAYQSMVPGIQEAKVEYLAIAQQGYPGARLKPGEADGLLSVGNMATHDRRALHMEDFCVQGVMFILTFQGVLSVKVNHQKHLVHPGELLLLQPGTRFAIGDPVVSCVRLGWLLLDVKTLEPGRPWRWPGWLMLEASEKRALTQELVKRGVGVQKVSKAFIEAYTRLTMLGSSSEVPHRGSRLRQLLSLAMLELLESCQRAAFEKGKKSPRSLRAVQAFLHRLPGQLKEPWTIGSMAEACGIGVSKFSEQVNILTAESPAKHLARLRLEKACDLLRKTTVPLRVIAQETGFSCVHYFSKAFVRFYHKSPNQFRSERLTERFDSLA